MRRKGGKAPIADKIREEILKEVEERIKAMTKDLLEAIMREERTMYLEEHPTKANGYYNRDLLTLVGPVEGLRVPACGKGIFIRRSCTTEDGLLWGFQKSSSLFTPQA